MSDSSQPDPAANTADAPASALIAAALADLEHTNPSAHALLVSISQEGFFEGQQGKRAINQLADRLLMTLQEGSHAA